MIGTSVASADLFGIDFDVLDIFDKHKKKKGSDHPQSTVGGQSNGGSTRPDSKPKPTSSVGAGRTGEGSSGPSARSSSTDAPQSGRVGSSRQAPSAATTRGIGQAPSAAVSGGGGSGGVQTNGSIDRAPNLAPVPTTPNHRKIVIRSTPPQAPSVPAPAAPAPIVPAPVAPPPVVVPPVPVVVAPPAPPAPAAPPAEAAPNVPAPSAEPPAAQPLSVPTIPESFRVGYADYLRVASTTDLLLAVLPGLSVMVLMTAAGGVIGVRQARAAQTLPSPQIARFLP